MQISVFHRPLSQLEADLLAVVWDPETRLAEPDDPVLGHVFEEAQQGFEKERLKRELFRSLGPEASVKNVVVFSTTLSKSYNVWENVKIFAARALSYGRDYNLGHVAFLLNHRDGAAFVGKAAEGFLLGGYRFDKYKKKTGEAEPKISIVVRPEDQGISKDRLRRYTIVSEQVNRCRDLVNEPGGAVVPQTLARVAKDVAAEGKLGWTILNERELERQGYRGLVVVGRGSVHRPRMIILRYKPPRSRKKSPHHLALLGKGITFDTGGISLKPAEGMEAMKGDMAGGAAVISAMAAIARLKPSLEVTGIVAAAENFPGAHAQRPGDILVAKNGKSIVVDNTDAEGRLVLTDALARAGEEKATHIVDIATLTGACVRALGTAVAGVLGRGPELVQAVIRSGQNHGEVIWELPLVEEYREMLKTPYADINNVGGKVAGTITAGLFLREFVPEGVAWAHLDIAGPFIVDKKWKYYGEGATGFGVKTLVDLCERFDEYFPYSP